MSPLLLVYIDAYHLGDPLFLQRFAPVVKAHEGPLMLLHGPGEAAERALEAAGRFVERRGGVLAVEDAAGRALVERAGRDLNRQIVHALNEAGVAALRLSGADRGLLKESGAGELAVGRTGWLRTLVRQGVVPVVALLADAAGEAVEVAPERAVTALADAFGTSEGEGPPIIVVLARGASNGGGGLAVAEPETVGRMMHSSVRIRVALPSALRGAGVPAGTDLSGGGA